MSQSPDRFRFFDRVRTAVILLVVAFHVSAAHTGFPVYIMETNSHMGFAYFNLICNAFIMNTLFFVAGFFSVASLLSVGVSWCLAEFFLHRMPRLGLALIISLFTGVLLTT